MIVGISRWRRTVIGMWCMVIINDSHFIVGVVAVFNVKWINFEYRSGDRTS